MISILEKKNKIIIFLFFTLPLIYILGVALVEIFFFILLINFILQQKNFNFFSDKKYFFLIIFSIYISINHLIQFDKYDVNYFEYSLLFHIRYPLMSILVVYYLKLIERKNHHINYIILFLIFLGLIFIDSFYQIINGKSLLGYKLLHSRVSSFFGDELVLGSFLITLLPIKIWFVFFFKEKLEKYFSIIIFYLISCSSIIIFLSGGRTSFALLLIFLLMLFIFLNKYKKLLSITYAFIFLSIVGFSQIDETKSLVYRVFVKPFHQVTNNIYTNTKIKSLKEEKRQLKDNLRVFSEDHHNHYKLALHLFKKEPVFGQGPKGFRFYCRSVNYEYKEELGICSTHPHNYLMQIISELGVVGLLFYLLALYYVVINLVKCIKSKDNKKNKELLVISSCMILTSFFPFFPSGNYFNNWISIINYYFIGFYLYSNINYYKE